MLKVMREIQTPFSDSLGNMSGGGIVGQTNFNAVIQTGINFWDKVVIAAFIFAVMMLFVSSFLVDAHPFFILL